MIKFNRLARITVDTNLIAKALKNSDLIQVSEDSTKVRRKPALPLPENSLEYWQDIKKRTVYVKGFDPETKLDDIIEYMKQFGKLDNVLMRREKSEKRTFKGSVFVTFKTQELAEAFSNNDAKEFKGKEISKMMQLDYWAKKQEEIKERRRASRAAKLAKKEQVAEKKGKGRTYVTFMKGLVLSVENLPKEGCSVQKLKEFFKQFGDVQYAVYEGGDTAQIRFSGSGETVAADVWKAALEKSESGKVMFDGNEIKGKALEGEEEEAYWKDFNKNKVQKMVRVAKKNKKARKQARKLRAKQEEPRGVKRKAELNEAEGESEKKARHIVFEDDDEE